MKNVYLPLLLLFIISFSSCEPDNSNEEPEAEDIIEIPDQYFKAKLVSSNSADSNGDGIGDRDVDLNNDGEIQRSEAVLIEGLILPFDYEDIGRYVDLTGIENFINITYLKISGSRGFMYEENSNSELISYDFTKLKKLEYFELNNVATNYFETVDLSGLDRLKEVNLIYNRPNEYGEDYKIPINYIDVKCKGPRALRIWTLPTVF